VRFPTIFGVAVLALTTSIGAIGANAVPPEQKDEAQHKDELPEGPGRKILADACTVCHGLEEITKFKGYYTRAEWADVVATMVSYGADVPPKDVDVLVDYLAKNFGKP
jgi:hypothetical protein